MRVTRRAAIAAAIIPVLAGLAGCAGAAEQQAAVTTEPVIISASPAPVASATPTPTPEPEPVPRWADPTCENIMAADFETTWVPTELDVNEPLLSGGITCRWQQDPTVGTDNVLMYGWASLTQERWDQFVASKTTSEPGWFTETGERGEYVTTQSEYWVQDHEGYGTTYLFTGDAVISAMTKDETNDVTGPPLLD